MLQITEAETQTKMFCRLSDQKVRLHYTIANVITVKSLEITGYKVLSGVSKEQHTAGSAKVVLLNF